MTCFNGHDVSIGDGFCQVCGVAVIQEPTHPQWGDAIIAGQTFGLVCANGHPLAAGHTFCEVCGQPAPDFHSGFIPPAEPSRPKWLFPVVGGLIGAMVLGMVVFLVLPSSSSSAATRSMTFHYVYPGETCAQTGPVHDGTLVEVTNTAGHLLTTGTLTTGITSYSNGSPSCSYVVHVRVPENVGTYYFRAEGDRNVYRVYRSTIDTTQNGWATVSTVTVGVAVVAWSGSVWSAY